MSPSTRPPAHLPSGATVGVLETNRTLAQRIARVLRAATPGEEVAVESDPASLRALLGPSPRLLAGDVSELDLLLDWAHGRYRGAKVIVWCAGDTTAALQAMRSAEALSSLVAFPSFLSMPRPWELLFAARSATEPHAAAPRLSELVAWGATTVKYRPTTSRERDLVVAELSAVAERAGVGTRLAQKVGEVAHELVMNAMYDAPVDQYGEPRFAHDRAGVVRLSPEESPTVRFAFDGALLGLEVSDPFGLLRREHVIDGILRGQRGDREDDPSRLLDTSFGGAGLGLHRVYAAASSLVVRVSPGNETRVTVLFDADLGAREARRMPVSLHLL